MSQSAFEKIGGDKAADKIVILFYSKVLQDPHISHFFDEIDIIAQIAHQKKFLKYALCEMPYPGKSLRKAHEHLNLDESHFDAVIDHFKETLTEVGLPTHTITEVMAILRATRDDVLNL
ncbi:MAG: group 1 truncated hemoglobin [Alphaproteobacteria bacterium]